MKRVLAQGGAAAVIRNTVGLAQRTYRDLKQALAGSDIELELFHARFPFNRRQQIENKVLDRYGKGPDGQPGNPRRPRKAILVATQVIEQSLDLDFDLLITDVAPIDLVLQRAGRLWRHHRAQRGRVGQPSLWLLSPDYTPEKIPLFGPSEKIYARYVLLRSFLVLDNLQAVRLPADLEDFIERVYASELPRGLTAAWERALAASAEEFRQDSRRQRNTAKSLLIRRPDAETVLEQQNLRLEEDDPEAHVAIRAATRDADPTVQLIVVYRGPWGDALDPNGRHTVRLILQRYKRNGDRLCRDRRAARLRCW